MHEHGNLLALSLDRVHALLHHVLVHHALIHVHAHRNLLGWDLVRVRDRLLILWLSFDRVHALVHHALVHVHAHAHRDLLSWDLVRARATVSLSFDHG